MKPHLINKHFQGIFVGSIQEMSETEIKDIMDPIAYQRIKQMDENPQFRTFVIGHEGESTGKLVGVGPVVKKWMKSAIQILIEKLKIGTKIFFMHANTNEHTGRTPIGELIGKGLKNIKDKLSAIGVTYIYPEFRGLKTDVASVEAFVDVRGPDFKISGHEVNEVTGIALGNTEFGRPGFPGATLLTQVQEFITDKEKVQFMDNVTLSDVKQFILENKTLPSQVFDIKVLTEDPVIIGYVKEQKGSEYSARKRIETDHEVELKEKTDEITTLETENKSLKGETLQVKAKDKLPEILTNRKIEGKRKDFIEGRFSNFKSEGEAEKLDTEINVHIDNENKEFDLISNVFDYKEGDGKGTEEPPAGGTGEGQQQSGEVDLTDPDKNPFIPQIEKKPAT